MRRLITTISLILLCTAALSACGYKLSNPLYQDAQSRKATQHLHNHVCIESKQYSAFQRRMVATLQNQQWLAKPNQTTCYTLSILDESVSIPNQSNDISQAQNVQVIFHTTLQFVSPSKQTLFTKEFTASDAIFVNQGELISENNRLMTIKSALYDDVIQSFILYLSSNTDWLHPKQPAVKKP